MLNFEDVYRLAKPDPFATLAAVRVFRRRERRKKKLRIVQKLIGLAMIVGGIASTFVIQRIAPSPNGPDFSLAVIAGGLGAWLLFGKRTYIR